MTKPDTKPANWPAGWGKAMRLWQRSGVGLKAVLGVAAFSITLLATYVIGALVNLTTGLSFDAGGFLGALLGLGIIYWATRRQISHNAELARDERTDRANRGASILNTEVALFQAAVVVASGDFLIAWAYEAQPAPKETSPFIQPLVSNPIAGNFRTAAAYIKNAQGERRYAFNMELVLLLPPQSAGEYVAQMGRAVPALNSLAEFADNSPQDGLTHRQCRNISRYLFILLDALAAMRGIALAASPLPDQMGTDDVFQAATRLAGLLAEENSSPTEVSSLAKTIRERLA